MIEGIKACGWMALMSVSVIVAAHIAAYYAPIKKEARMIARPFILPGADQ